MGGIMAYGWYKLIVGMREMKYVHTPRAAHPEIDIHRSIPEQPRPSTFTDQGGPASHGSIPRGWVHYFECV